MESQKSRKGGKSDKWPRKVTLGRVSVTVYRRKRGDGSWGFEVANYADGTRRLEARPNAEAALHRATEVARKMSEQDVVAAAMTNEQAAAYASAIQSLAPFNISLPVVADTVAQCLKLVGDVSNLVAASKFYAARHRTTTPKQVAEVVKELIDVKEARGGSLRDVQDLRSRLNRFATDFKKDIGNVTSAEIQAWLDGKKLRPQNYANFRTVLSRLFQFAVARAYASDNPVAAVERIKIKGGETPIFTPKEITRLLAATAPDFLPCIALGAFAGLRSAEIERLEWSDIHLAERCIIVGRDKSKTASRRVVPVSDNLAAWLAPYAERGGMVWTGTHEEFYDAQQEAAAATAVEANLQKGIKAVVALKWKANALRHSYASYRFAETGDAGRVAGELGNSAAVVHKHYRELVNPADAVKWFAVTPETPANVTALQAAGA